MRGAFGQVAGGSSPRVRGTPLHKCCVGVNAAVHPRVCGELDAVAGRTTVCRPVHPRVCGELLAGVRGLRASAGSSPRVRGTLGDAEPPAVGDRFIPACAGNSSWSATDGRHSAVHPRVCGELGLSVTCSSPMSGSSPRVRGTHVKQRVRQIANRFIPACAGNSRGGVPHRGGPAVHPRVCGELGNWRTFPKRLTGSSPRVRGTPRFNATRWVSDRFIPACAGNSALQRHAVGFRPVHPRVCGELPLSCTIAWVVLRFIPACAGNS